MDKKKTKNKTSLQFKLTLMFFFVMLVSASISVSVLVMVCSPVIKSNAEQQLVELSMAMDQLEEKGGDPIHCRPYFRLHRDRRAARHL